MSRKSRFASKERMADLRREGRVPVSALGIRLILAALVLLFLLPLLPKVGSSPILALFAKEQVGEELQRAQLSWSWIGNLAFTYLSIPILGTSLLLLIGVLPVAFTQSKFFISFGRLRRTFEVRDTRVTVIGRILVLLLGVVSLLWLLSTQVISMWGVLLKSGDEHTLWNSLLLSARRSALSFAGVLLLLGVFSTILHQFWFRIVNRESDGRFRKTRE